MEDKRQIKDSKHTKTHEIGSRVSDFVLDKFIFSNVFEKDIKRIYIYKKSERLAKAIHLVTPAFVGTPSLRNRLDEIAVGLIDGAVLPPAAAREALSRELLALSSMLSVARMSSLLSDMNADIIIREAHILLQEIAGYEAPRLALDEVPTLADFAKNAPRQELRTVFRADMLDVTLDDTSQRRNGAPTPQKGGQASAPHKGHVSDKPLQTGRQDAILSVLSSKGTSYIKDISTVIKDVSEKTIQRELQSLVSAGKVHKSGERRWTQYSLA